ncbi:peptidyl-prolyl cis-trans isomerase [Salipiger sp. PrR002]|uniref:peptidylprolyl isomerase n=1 Tax=Salipiger sp. PrR002 TaxID=2706489 RepID=UPI0013BDAD4F|nr:peptidylprolyl isomerase [Salipiger sp. PrR002]NDW00839.1 peptidyl-prolyl cis-trans isomerase [Salipiger sp. PrR002]NDW58040.1 peptidyl-prolyl cis-trans isomerase [Salipiger sp. PrR004]
MQRILRSPLLHFFVIAGAIFGIYALLDDTPEAPPPDAITLSVAEAQNMRERFAAVWNRQPTPAEMDGLLSNWAREEAMVREALRLGLDSGDAAIRQRLAQKMEFIGESGAAVLEPDEAALAAFVETHRERFALPARYAFEQVLLDEQDPGEIEALRVKLQEGADPMLIGRGAMLPPALPLTGAPAIDRSFGSGFHSALAELPKGQWQGPVQSAYGLHLIRITDSAAPELPPLEAIRDRVEAEWRAAKAKEMGAAFSEALMERYEITLPSSEEVLAQ